MSRSPSTEIAQVTVRDGQPGRFCGPLPPCRGSGSWGAPRMSPQRRCVAVGADGVPPRGTGAFSVTRVASRHWSGSHGLQPRREWQRVGRACAGAWHFPLAHGAGDAPRAPGSHGRQATAWAVGGGTARPSPAALHRGARSQLDRQPVPTPQRKPALGILLSRCWQFVSSFQKVTKLFNCIFTTPKYGEERHAGIWKSRY